MSAPPSDSWSVQRVCEDAVLDSLLAHRRCPFYRPGDLYKCEAEAGHIGAHQAHARTNSNIYAPGTILRWTEEWQPPPLTEEVILKLRGQWFSSEWYKIETSTLKRERILAKGEEAIRAAAMDGMTWR